MPSVVICDDHRLFGESVRVVLEHAGYEVPACTTGPDDGTAAVHRYQPDVYLMDRRFAAVDGLSGLKDALAGAPSTRALVLTAFVDRDAVESARAAGAFGLVGKSQPIETILAAVGEVAAGRRVFAAPLHDDHSRAVAGNGVRPEALLWKLTAREREVLERLVQGQDTAGLARDMGVTYSTARTHIQNLLTKLGVHSKLQAVALIRALVDEPEMTGW